MSVKAESKKTSTKVAHQGATPLAKAMRTAHCAKVLSPAYLRTLSQKLKTAMATATEPTPKGWFAVGSPADQKSVSVSELTDELAFARSALASVYGNKPVPFVIPFSQTFTASSGVILGVANLDVTSAPEWAAISSLFHEWKFEGGRVEFTVANSPLAALVPDSMGVMSYDPVDATALTNTRNGCEYKQHKLYRPTVTGSGTGATLTATQTWNSKGGGSDPLHFSFTTKDLEAEYVNASGNVVVMPGQWMSTVGVAGQATTQCGYVKPYFSGAAPTASVQVAAIIYLNILVRSRT